MLGDVDVAVAIHASSDLDLEVVAKLSASQPSFTCEPRPHGATDLDRTVLPIGS